MRKGLYLSPIVGEVLKCIRGGSNPEEVAECISDVADMEWRELLGCYVGLLMKMYGIDRCGEDCGPYIQVGPVRGVVVLCIGCPDREECRSFIEDIAEWVEGLPRVVASLIEYDGGKVCVKSILWDEVRREVM